MSVQIGSVMDVFIDGSARVKTDRKGGCGGCSPGHGCRGCLSGNHVVSRVANTAGASAGDIVRIEVATGPLLASAAMFYLVPIVFMVVAAVAGFEFWGTTAGSAIAGIGAFALVLAVVKYVADQPAVRQRILPRITSVVLPKASDGQAITPRPGFAR